MERTLEDAFLAVLDEIERGTEITRDWLDARYPKWSDRIEEALDLKSRLRDRPSVGPYRIVRELGRGGMGVVYLAENADGEHVAVKVLHRELLRRPGILSRLLSEAEAGRELEHENVVRTLDVGTELREGRRELYLVLEYLEGKTLRERLDEDGPLDEARCLTVARSVARALREIHGRDALHLDLKPENIIETPDGTIKVMDFGVARLAAEPVLDAPEGAFAGTLLYAAPEQFQMTRRHLDGRADLYALGCILYELATGHVPTGPEPPGVSPFFDALVQRLLAVDRDERFASAAQVLHALVGAAPGFVGRDQEFVTLHDRWAQARRGRGAALLVVGDAGVGKTRLLDEFLATVDGTVVRGTGDTPLLDGFKRALPIDALPEALASTPLLVPEFERLWRGEGTPDPAAVETGLVLLARFIAPAVVVAEDLHFATPNAQRAFLALGRAVPTDPVLVLGASRPGHALAGAEALDLEPLSADAVHDLVRQQRGDADEAVARRLYEISGGNALFAVSALRSWDDDDVPAGIDDWVRARLERLADHDRKALSAAACHGMRFDPALLAGDLDGLVRNGAFEHGLIHRAVYDAIPAEERTALHASIGRTLPADDPNRIRHLLLGNERDAALPHLEDALERLGPQHNPDAIVEITDLALPHVEGPHRATVLLHRARALQHLSRHEESAALLEEALAMPGLAPVSTHVPILIQYATVLAQLAKHEEARRIAHTARAIARRNDDTLGELQALWRLTDELTLTGRRHRAVVVSRRMLQRARADDRFPLARALESTAKVFLGRGLHKEACEYYAECLRVAKMPEDVATVISAEGHLGLVRMRQGDFAASQAHMERCRDLARRSGLRYFEAMSTGVLAGLYRKLGRFADAVATNRLQLRLSTEVGAAEGVVRAHMGLAYLALLLGDEKTFEYERAEAIRKAASLSIYAFEVDIEMLDGVWARRQLDDEKAAVHFERGIVGAERIGYPMAVARGHAELAAIRRDRAHLEKADAIARKIDCADVVVQCACLGAILGDDPVAAERTVREWEERAMVPVRVDCLHDLWLATKDERHLLEARRLLHAMLVYAPPESRDLLLTDPVWRAVHEESERRFG